MDPRIGAYISYYAREGMMHRLQAVCNEVLRRSSQPVLQFWRSYALLTGGQHAEALRELQAIQHNPDVELAAAAAMLVIHESSRVVDQEAVVSLSAKLEVEERSAAGAAALHLANFYTHRHSFERARGLLERALRMPAEPGLQQRLAAALGWCIVQQQQHQQEVDGEPMDGGELAAAAGHFKAALQLDSGDLEALLGHARALELQQQIDQAAEVLSEAAVRFSWFVPGLLEHLRLLLAQKEWEGVVESANLVLHAEPDNATALSMLALVELVKEGDSRQAADLLGRAAAALVKQEPSGAALCFNMARAFGRLAGSEPSLLNSTIMLAERAVALQPGNADYLVELASQRLAQGDATKAGELYTQALGADELHLPASLGVVESLLARGELEDAAMHLQLLPELVSAAKLASAPVGVSAVSRGGASAGVLVAGAGDSLDEGTLDSAASAAEQHLLYLQGLLAWQQGEAATGLQQLQRSCQMLLAAAEGVPLGLQTFVVLQPGRIMSVVQALLGSLGGEPRGANDAPAPLLGCCMRLLEMMGRYTGALPAAQLLYARALFLNASYDAASRKAGDLLRVNPGLVAGHLLVAKAALQQGRPEDAAVALEAALSADFTVKDSPLYALVNAQVAVAEQRFDQARKVLEAALSLPGVKGKLSAEQRGRLAARGALPSTTERASLYLLLVEVLRRSGTAADQAEARKVMSEALSLFTGTSEEARVTVADCDLAVAAGDVEGALQRLGRVLPSSPHYPRSRVALADIHLKQRKDRAAYIQCYLDLLEQRPGFDSHCLLGEALLAIQEPEKAVAAFEAALEFYPKDAALAVKCADALVAAHDYHRAVDYYNRAIRNDPTQLELQHRLAQLLIRLGQAGAAAALLGRCLERARAGAGSTESLAMDVDTWLLLSRLQEQQGHHDEALASHAKAVEIQELLLARLAAQGAATGMGAADRSSMAGGRESMAGGSSGGGVGGRGGGMGANAQRQRAATLCFDLAEQHRKTRAFDKASEMYEAALKQVPGHVPSLLALARLALAGGDLEGCRERCIALLGAAPDHEEAAMMVAEIMAYQEQYDAAVATFHALLARQPCHYGALVRLLGLLRRAGRLASDAPRYIAAAEAAAGGRPESQAGLRYCQGLQQWWLNKPREALKHFAAARKDPRWASEALLHMVEVALAPDAVLDENWATAGDDANNAAGGGGEGAGAAAGGKKGGKSAKEGRAEARAVAQGLLHQLRPDEVDPSKYKVLSAYVQMSSKAKGDVEAALSSLLDLAAAEPNNVPVLLALSHGFLLLKQAPKARNQLKRVAKIPYQPEAGEEFERAWLALADLHIQGGKFDLAQELCQRCLKYNKSCAHAWELLGSIAEREAAYADAAAHYEQAWRLASQSSCVLGYKLSFNYLKAARCVDAVTVAQAVLKLDPNYPAIEKEVLQKAWAGLRP